MSQYKFNNTIIYIALLKTANDFLLSLGVENVSLPALLDLSAAFDMITHSILLHRDFGIQDIALEWFSSYLTNRIQSVSIHCHTSEPAPIPSGVPQGSALGPAHFFPYNASPSIVIEKHSVLHHSYTDDSQLHKSAAPNQISHLLPMY